MGAEIDIRVLVFVPTDFARLGNAHALRDARRR
jgi:hypothetical protein